MRYGGATGKMSVKRLVMPYIPYHLGRFRLVIIDQGVRVGLNRCRRSRSRILRCRCWIYLSPLCLRCDPERRKEVVTSSYTRIRTLAWSSSGRFLYNDAPICCRLLHGIGLMHTFGCGYQEVVPVERYWIFVYLVSVSVVPNTEESGSGTVSVVLIDLPSKSAAVVGYFLLRIVQAQSELTPRTGFVRICRKKQHQFAVIEFFSRRNTGRMDEVKGLRCTDYHEVWQERE